jgi:hypothetical protein
MLQNTFDLKNYHGSLETEKISRGTLKAKKLTRNIEIAKIK